MLTKTEKTRKFSGKQIKKAVSKALSKLKGLKKAQEKEVSYANCPLALREQFSNDIYCSINHIQLKVNTCFLL
jgi:hypothetical protein